MMTLLVARIKFIKIKVILGIIPKASQTKFHQIRITKPKVIHVQVPVPRRKKTKKWKKNGYKTEYQNGASRRLQIGPGFRDYKSGLKHFKSG